MIPSTTGRGDDALLSVVAPVYNEEELIGPFVDRVRATLGDAAWELILVDDGSRDRTPLLLRELAASDARVKVVFLSRNFGHQVALSAGLEHASGRAVVMIDSDLQDPPEVIPELVAAWREGADVVSAVRTRRPGETVFKLGTASLFYRAFRWITDLDIEADSGDFRLLDRRALDALLTMPERSRFLRGMTVWIGFRQQAVAYERDARTAGETKYPLRKMVRFASDALLSFSSRPLQLATYAGFAISVLAFVATVLVFVLRLTGNYLPGFSMLTIIVLLLGGVQLMAIGVLGEYLARVYDEVKSRPLYFVGGTLNAPGSPVAGEVDGAGPPAASRPRTPRCD
jgi:polyisoprenyl-phosphate glycosyltransferase